MRWLRKPEAPKIEAKPESWYSKITALLSATVVERPPGEFVRPEIMPGVVPAGEEGKARLAMDNALQPAYAYANIGWSGTGFPGYPALAELAQNVVYRRCSEIWAKQATRKWVKIVSSGDGDKADKIAALEAALKRFNVRSVFRDAIECDGLFGRAQVYIDVKAPSGGLASDLPKELDQPLLIDPAKIKKGSLNGFKLVEPLWTYPAMFNADNPLKLDFYRPNGWYVMAKTVHRTRMLNFCARPVPDILKPAYNFGGVSMSQLCSNYVNNWIRTQASVGDLIHSFSTSGIKLNMSGVLTEGGAEQLLTRLNMFNRMRDNRGVLALDKDTEEFFQFDTPLSGVAELQRDALVQVGFAAGIPMVFFLGEQPSGMNASSDGEIRVFYDAVHGLQEDVAGQPMNVVLDILQLNEFGEIDPDIGYEWVPLYQLDDEARARVRKSDADAAVALTQAGIIYPEEVRASLAADPESGYASIDVEDVPEAPEVDETDDGDDPAQDSAFDSEHWITTKTDSKLLINGEGTVIGGAGGKLNCTNVSPKSKSNDVSKSSGGTPAKRSVSEIRAELDSTHAAWNAESKAFKDAQKVDRLQNEGGGGYSHAEVISEAAYNKYSPLVSALENELFAAEWTPEVTATRRAGWNSEISALGNRVITGNEIRAIEKKVGHSFTDLKRAIAAHK